MNLPATVKIVDIIYTVEYVERVADVDTSGRELLHGQIDYLKRSIRIHSGDRKPDDIWQTLWHEMLHGISERLRIQDYALHHDENAIDLLAIGINIVMGSLQDNPFLREL